LLITQLAGTKVGGFPSESSPRPKNLKTLPKTRKTTKEKLKQG
jgi:hypothetical protein